MCGVRRVLALPSIALACFTTASFHYVFGVPNTTPLEFSQAAVRGKLVRALKLTRLATAEQHAAIALLRARRHSAAPGEGALLAEDTILREPRQPSMHTL